MLEAFPEYFRALADEYPRWNFIFFYDEFQWNRLVSGFKNTVWLSIACVIFSVIIGIGGAWLQGSPNRFLRAFVQGYIQFFRNTPPFVQLLFFITDVSKAIKTTSLRMQARDGLLTEQHNQMTTLVSTIQLMAGRDGEYSARLLAESQCSLSDDERGCTNEDFENSEEVSFKGFQLKHRHNSRYKPLSELRFGIVTALETELKKYFPEHEFGDFKVLRPQTFPKDLAGVTFHGIAELPNLARYVCTTSHEYCWIGDSIRNETPSR